MSDNDTTGEVVDTDGQPAVRDEVHEDEEAYQRRVVDALDRILGTG